MHKIYSKQYPDKLCHIIVRKADIAPGREEIVPVDNFIQCARLNMKTGKTFRPHMHIWKWRERDVIAQESWVVIQGSVQCDLYDVDGTLLDSPVLYPGDASFTLEGGHTYIILEDDTLVYEYKTGPYEGQKLDKVFLDEL